jgi:hypothetical protein
MIKVGFGEAPKPAREARALPRTLRPLTVRLGRLARFCGFARLWRYTPCRSAPGKIFVGHCEDIMLNE